MGALKSLPINGLGAEYGLQSLHVDGDNVVTYVIATSHRDESGDIHDEFVRVTDKFQINDLDKADLVYLLAGSTTIEELYYFLTDVVEVLERKEERL
jgi:hypothetical protein